MESKDLLIADIEHFGESLLKNEEVGEKRFEFVVTLATAVSAGLVALATSDSKSALELSASMAILSLAGLLIVALLAYLRLLQRNRVRSEYQRTLKYIRNVYRSACAEPILSTYDVPRKLPSKGRFRGGYAETMGILTGTLLGGWLFLLGFNQRLAGAIGAVVGASLWVLARERSETAMAPAQYFRAGVGAVLINGDGSVLALERSGVPGAWQLPQGGIEDGEEPATAIRREIEEETGITAESLRLVGHMPEPLAYLLPPELRSAKTGMGQVAMWFFFEYLGEPSAIALPAGGEFRASSWRSLEEVAGSATPFRRAVYSQLLKSFDELRPATVAAGTGSASPNGCARKGAQEGL